MINVLYCVNSKYAPIAAVSIKSLLECNKEEYIKIFIFETDFSESDKMNLIKLSYGNSQIEFINIQNQLKEIENIGVTAFHGNYLTYGRLLVGDLIKEKKILYLDADTIILGNIKKMYSMDISGCLIAASKDLVNRRYRDKIGLDYGTYFNAGIMLVNLDEWRRQECKKEIFNFIKAASRRYIYADQDIINLLFRNQIEPLPCKYCAFFPIYEWKVKDINKVVGERNYYQIKELKEAVEHPVIVHITGTVTGHPWCQENYFKYKNEWDNYLKGTGFYKNFEYKKVTYSKRWIFFNYRLYKFLPYWIWIKIYILKEIRNNKSRIRALERKL